MLHASYMVTLQLIPQGNLHQQQEDEARNRQDLHDRVEGMVVDVETAIRSKEQASIHGETFKTDEM
jgi:hypothetical protein